MTASEKPHRSLRRGTEGESGPEAAPPWPEHTVPGFLADRPPEDDGPSLLGFHAEYVHDTTGSPGSGRPAVGVAPPPRPAPAPAVDSLVYARRAEVPGGLLLVLAGIAGAVSLLLPWTTGDGATGSSLVDRAVAVLGTGARAILRSSLWQPLAVVVAGYVLLLLGLLLLVPARTHRALGVLAFLVAAPAAAGVVVPLADAGWSADRFGPGMWCAAAVGCLGLLGALKAMLTGPRIVLRAGNPTASGDAVG